MCNPIKRAFDLIFSLIGLLLTCMVIFLAFLIATIETQSNGFFLQKRVGRGGIFFSVVKIKTMKQVDGVKINITTSNDVRITKSGKFFRYTKIDELPTLWNVLKGDMSFVGPRPDIPGYVNKLTGNDRRILDLRPGITGPATLKYANEEKILSTVDDPVKYNDEVIFPDKVKMNLEYLDNWSFWLDIKIIFQTIFRTNY